MIPKNQSLVVREKVWIIVNEEENLVFCPLTGEIEKFEDIPIPSKIYEDEFNIFKFVYKPIVDILGLLYELGFEPSISNMEKEVEELSFEGFLSSNNYIDSRAKEMLDKMSKFIKEG